MCCGGDLAGPQKIPTGPVPPVFTRLTHVAPQAAWISLAAPHAKAHLLTVYGTKANNVGGIFAYWTKMCVG